MRERSKKQQAPGAITFLKILAAMYIVSGLLLTVLAVLVSKMEQEELIANAGMIVVYVLSCAVGGFLAAKVRGNRKFLWGMLMGAMYFATLFVVSFALNRGIDLDPVHLTTVMAICIGAGMAGGMIG